MFKDRRWVIIGDDGRHVTIGRHSDPSEIDLLRAAEALRGTNSGGWLAITEGNYYSAEGKFSVMMVRELVPSLISWEIASKEFLRLRTHALFLPPKPN